MCRWDKLQSKFCDSSSPGSFYHTNWQCIHFEFSLQMGRHYQLDESTRDASKAVEGSEVLLIQDVSTNAAQGGLIVYKLRQ